jgi:hypothetical protein
MGRDWLEWHEQYDSPDSPLAHRLRVVQRDLRQALIDAPRDGDGIARLVSMCAGEGRDVLPVLAEHHGGAAVHALLVELNPALSDRARDTATRLGLPAVSVCTADAGPVDPYLSFVPISVLLACGVFGNTTVEDAERTILAMPDLLADGGIVIWTRGRGDDGSDPSLHLRTRFADAGFSEVSFASPEDDRFRVGVHRLGRRPGRLASLEPGERLFSFV